MADRDIDLFDCSVAILDGNTLLYNGKELDVGTVVNACWMQRTVTDDRSTWTWALPDASPGPYKAETFQERFTLGTFQMDESSEQKLEGGSIDPVDVKVCREQMAKKAETALGDKLKAIHQEMRDGGATTIWRIWRQRLFICPSDWPSKGLFGMAACCDVSLLGVKP